MAERERIWSFDNEDHRALFGQLLAPLIVAAGSIEIRNWRDEAYTRAQLRTWMLMLSDVPEPVLRAAIDRKVMDGVTWMARPGDVKAVCCDIVDERRAVVAVAAKKIQDDCLQCRDQRGFKTVTVNGVASVDRCDCWLRARAILDAIEPALKRPALPAYEPEPVA